MYVTEKILEKKFDECNERYFNDELPSLFLGTFSKKRPFAKFTFLIKKKNGKKELVYKKISVSNYYDFTEEELTDILAHEMIHYYIAYNGLKDNKEHGKIFLSIANRLNDEFGLHIEKTKSTSSYVKRRAVK
jgi:predicted SprT family Zn-dependent metalloprotease